MRVRPLVHEPGGAYLLNQRFESLFAWRMVRQNATLNESRVLLDAARRIITLIANELDDEAS